MPIYVLVAAQGQPELWDAPLAEHLKDHSLVDDGAGTTVLRVVQPPCVAFGYVLAEVVVVRPAGGCESQQQLLKQTTMTVVSLSSGGLTPWQQRREVKNDGHMPSGKGETAR